MKRRASDIGIRGCTAYFLPVKTRVPLKFGHGDAHLGDVPAGAARGGGGRREARRAGGARRRSACSGCGRARSRTRRATPRSRISRCCSPARGSITPCGATRSRSATRSSKRRCRRCSRVSTPAGPPGSRCRGWRPWSAAPPSTSPCTTPTARLLGLPVYETYDAAHLNRDLAAYLEAARGSGVSFAGLYPARLLRAARADAASRVAPRGRQGPDRRVRAHGRRARRRLPGAAGGLDPPGRPQVPEGEAAGQRRRVGLPSGWSPSGRSPIGRRRGLAQHGLQLHGDRPALRERHPRPADGRAPAHLRHDPLRRAAVPLRPGAHRIDVHSVSARKPLFMDESAHDWRLVRLGRRLGWTGVALKTCKTQTGALLTPAGRRRTA